MLPRAALRKLVERDFEMNRMMMKEMNMNRLRSFRVAASLLAFCLLALLAPATADAQKDGTTHDVGVDGDIQAAIDGASDGDLNDDGVVDAADIGLLFAVWGSDDPEADFDGDGTVGAFDLGYVLGYWGPCP